MLVTHPIVHPEATEMPFSNTCRCGCGAPVTRRFKPGHDARLKSRLVKEARDGDESARRQLEALGWLHFVDIKPTAPDPTPRTNRPRPTAAQVEVTFSEPTPIRRTK